jgi:hypothetical protein
MNYKEFYKDLLNEALSISFAKNKNFTDEEKKQATEAVKHHFENGYNFYREKFGELAVSRFDFVLKDIRDHWRETVFSFDIIGKGGRDASELAFPGSEVEGLKNLKRPYRKYRDVKDAVEEIPKNPDSAYRGMSFEELVDAKKKGHFKSSGIMNIGDSQENYTFFGKTPSTARYYAASFQPLPSSVTRNKPGVIIEVPRDLLRPANITMSKKTGEPVGSEEEFVTDKSINFSDVKNLWLIVPEKSGFGSVDIRYDKFEKKYTEGSRFPSYSNYKIIHQKEML